MNQEEEREFKSFFKDLSEGNEARRCNYTTRLDTYGTGCHNDCRYCLHPSTPILMYDGTIKPIEEVQVGDEVYGVAIKGDSYCLIRAVVENKWEVIKPAFAIDFEDGRRVICSANHRWLTLNGWKGTKDSVENCEPLADDDSIISLTPEYREGEIRYYNAFKNEKIVSITPYSDSMRLIDITTSTENFVAEGFVSHNCYAKSLLSFRGLWKPNNPAISDINEIRKVIKKDLNPHTIVRLGGMTDCFQDAEREHRVTLQTIKALNEAGVGYLIVTKCKLVAEDEYIKAMDRSLAHIQVSITSTDAGISKRYEPGASLPEERIAAVEKLQREGFDVQVRLSPYIPQFVNIDRINAIKCDKILVEFLRVNSWIAKWMRDVDLRPYTLTKNGYKHLPLAVKKNLISKLKGFKEISVCEDVYGHWKYWKENFNHNPEDCCNLRLFRK